MRPLHKHIRLIPTRVIRSIHCFDNQPKTARYQLCYWLHSEIAWALGAGCDSKRIYRALVPITILCTSAQQLIHHQHAARRPAHTDGECATRSAPCSPQLTGCNSDSDVYYVNPPDTRLYHLLILSNASFLQQTSCVTSKYISTLLGEATCLFHSTNACSAFVFAVIPLCFTLWTSKYRHSAFLLDSLKEVFCFYHFIPFMGCHLTLIPHRWTLLLSFAYWVWCAGLFSFRIRTIRISLCSCFSDLKIGQPKPAVSTRCLTLLWVFSVTDFVRAFPDKINGARNLTLEHIRVHSLDLLGNLNEPAVLFNAAFAAYILRNVTGSERHLRHVFVVQILSLFVRIMKHIAHLMIAVWHTILRSNRTPWR